MVNQSFEMSYIPRLYSWLLTKYICQSAYMMWTFKYTPLNELIPIIYDDNGTTPVHFYDTTISPWLETYSHDHTPPNSHKPPPNPPKPPTKTPPHSSKPTKSINDQKPDPMSPDGIYLFIYVVYVVFTQL
jgi:hypothetical protein